MKSALFLIVLSACSLITYSQSLTIDGAPVLLPRITAAERDLITGQEGMLIFNSTEKKFQGFVGGGDPIVSSPPLAAMQYNLGDYQIALTPNQAGILQSVELYTEIAGVNGSLRVISAEPCDEYNVLATSNAVTTAVGWNTYTFSTPLAISNSTSYYIGTNSGIVNANLSQINNPLLEVLFWNGLLVCTPVVAEMAVKINLQGSWVNLN